MKINSLSVIIVNYNTAHLLPEMFAALESASLNIKLSCIIVDNASADRSIDLLKADYSKHQLLVNKTNVGFGRANNQALPYLQTGYVLLLNTDAFLAPDTLVKTIDYMDSHVDCGVLGVRLVSRDGSLQPSCRLFPTPLNVFLARSGLSRFVPSVRLVDDLNYDHSSDQECDWVPGCYFLIRREVIEKIGLFDPLFFLYCEEVDFCKRVKASGWKVVYYPHTSVVHIGGESARTVSELTSVGRQISTLQIESEMLYFRKHHGVWGLVLHMMLVTVADLILVVKDVVRRRGLSAMRSNWSHALVSWRLFFLTRLATKPTQ
jgi:N-acetylglucosaminyl-diphospho-decaprenol L-rhamnosyltransferase